MGLVEKYFLFKIATSNDGRTTYDYVAGLTSAPEVEAKERALYISGCDEEKWNVELGAYDNYGVLVYPCNWKEISKEEFDAVLRYQAIVLGL